MSPRGEQSMVPDVEFESYYGRQILKTPTWKTPDVPALPVPGWPGRGLGRPRRGCRPHRPPRARAGRPAGRRRGSGGRHGRPGPRPGPARALPPHAARHQADVPAVGRVVHPGAVRRALRCRGRLPGDRPPAAPGPPRRARCRRARPAARDLHRRPDRQHRRARLARGPPRAAVRLRRVRRHRRRRPGHGVHPARAGRAGPPDGRRGCRPRDRRGRVAGEARWAWSASRIARVAPGS